jgi:hypothetical protein
MVLRPGRSSGADSPRDASTPMLSGFSSLLWQRSLASIAVLDAASGKITLPAASHAILAGLRISLTLAAVLAMQAEPNGLGSGVVAQHPALRPAAMFADVVVIGLPALALNSLFFFCRRVVQGASAVTPMGHEHRGLGMFLRLAAANVPPLRGFLPWRQAVRLAPGAACVVEGWPQSCGTRRRRSRRLIDAPGNNKSGIAACRRLGCCIGGGIGR